MATVYLAHDSKHDHDVAATLVAMTEYHENTA